MSADPHKDMLSSMNFSKPQSDRSGGIARKLIRLTLAGATGG